jgi:translation initiation factor 1A
MPKNKGKGGKNRRRGKNENEEKRELIFKEDGQEYAQVLRMLGNGRLEAQCIDGVKRLCHIRGKMRKKVWVNQGDIVLVGLRDYQDAKGDVILKYMADEARSLKQYGELPENIRVNDTDAMMEGDENENAEYVACLGLSLQFIAAIVYAYASAGRCSPCMVPVGWHRGLLLAAAAQRLLQDSCLECSMWRLSSRIHAASDAVLLHGSSAVAQPDASKQHLAQQQCECNTAAAAISSAVHAHLPDRHAPLLPLHLCCFAAGSSTSTTLQRFRPAAVQQVVPQLEAECGFLQPRSSHC